MLVSEVFENLVQVKYEEAKKNGVSSIFLDENRLGGLMLYINKKPAFLLTSFEAGADKIYVGAESESKTS
jgi:hypothetical protein